LNTLIIEESNGAVGAVDIYQRLLDSRIIFISDYVDSVAASNIVANLLAKNSESQEEKITLILNADGGDVRAVFMVYDVMNLIKAPLEVICTGGCGVETTLLLAAGTPGMRRMTKMSTVEVGPLVYYSAFSGQISSMEDAALIKKLTETENKRFMTALAKHCGQKVKEFTAEFSQKRFLTAKEAIRYGIIDATL
jgi:ATP-dependent Clp protease protease subunit